LQIGDAVVADLDRHE